MELGHTFLESDQVDRFRPLAARYAGMGMARIRCDTPRWPELEPQPGVFKWDVLDAVVDACEAAGIKLHYNPADIPAHALAYYDETTGAWTDHPWEGYRSWFPPDSGQVLPTCWNPKRDIFDPEYLTTIAPECANPPRVKASSVFRLGSEIAFRYRYRIAYYAPPLNESDDERFFPLWTLVKSKFNGDWEPVTRMIYDDVVRPFAEGVASAFRDPRPGTPSQPPIEAPEAQTYGYAAAMLAYDCQSSTQRNNGIRFQLIDRAAVHGYAVDGPFPEAAINRITTSDGGWLRYIQQSGWSGEWGIGEVAPRGGEDPFSILEYIPVMRQLGAAWVTLMMDEKFFKEGTFANGTYEPNDLYDAVARQQSRMTSRHRAVSK